MPIFPYEITRKWAIGWRLTRWWFQTFFMFTLIWGGFQFWLIFFKGVETTNKLSISSYGFEMFLAFKNWEKMSVKDSQGASNIVIASNVSCELDSTMVLPVASHRRRKITSNLMDFSVMKILADWRKGWSCDIMAWICSVQWFFTLHPDKSSFFPTIWGEYVGTCSKHPSAILRLCFTDFYKPLVWSSFYQVLQSDPAPARKVTFSGLKWPPFGESTWHFEEAGSIV